MLNSQRGFLKGVATMSIVPLRSTAASLKNTKSSLIPQVGHSDFAAIRLHSSAFPLIFRLTRIPVPAKDMRSMIEHLKISGKLRASLSSARGPSGQGGQRQ